MLRLIGSIEARFPVPALRSMCRLSDNVPKRGIFRKVQGARGTALPGLAGNEARQAARLHRLSAAAYTAQRAALIGPLPRFRPHFACLTSRTPGKALEIVRIATVLSSRGLLVAHRGYTCRHDQSARPVKSHGAAKGRCRSSQACGACGDIRPCRSKPDFLGAMDHMPQKRRHGGIKATHLFRFLQER
jgi:hypothetical protein